MAPSTARSTLPWLVPVAATAAAIAAFLLHARVAAHRADVSEIYLADVWVSLVYPAVGAWFLSRGGARRVGLLLLLAGALALTGLAGEWAAFDALDGSLTPAGSIAAWLSVWSWTPYLLLPTALPLLYPDGRPRTRAAAVVATTAVGLAALVAVICAVAPGQVDDSLPLGNPLGVADWPVLADLAAALPGVAVVVLAPLAVVVLAVHRVRGPGPGTTAALVGSAAFVATALTADVLPYPWSDVWTAAGLSVLPLAIVVNTHAESVRAAERAEHRRLRGAREEERRRVRQELHDGVAPDLAGLSLHLEALSGDTAGEQRAVLARASRRLRDSAVEVRRIVDGLGPSVVDQLGLVDAVRVHADRITGGSAVVRAADGLPELPAGTEAAAYRIACEALTNAARHAGAASIEVEVQATDGDLHVTIRDDGVGGAAPRAGGLGLPGMVARAENSGGICRIVQREGGGTTVLVTLPVAGQEGATP